MKLLLHSNDTPRCLIFAPIIDKPNEGGWVCGFFDESIASTSLAVSENACAVEPGKTKMTENSLSVPRMTHPARI